MPRLDLSAGPLDYRVTGPDDGPTVVFVHGFLVDAGLWADVPDRLGARGYRCVVPTWPLGAHRSPMLAGADLSPHGLGALVVEALTALDRSDVTLVGNNTGGAVCQFALDVDASRVARLVLTNCDAFETFPPFPFSLLFRLARHPRAARAALTTMRSTRLRHSALGFGRLVRRRLSPAESLPWVQPYLDDPGVRRDVAAFARHARPQDLVDVGSRLGSFDRPVLLAWAVEDRFFRVSLAQRLAATFPDARLVEIEDARTFVPLDQPARLAEVIAEFDGRDDHAVGAARTAGSARFGPAPPAPTRSRTTYRTVRPVITGPTVR